MAFKRDEKDDRRPAALVDEEQNEDTRTEPVRERVPSLALAFHPGVLATRNTAPPLRTVVVPIYVPPTAPSSPPPSAPQQTVNPPATAPTQPSPSLTSALPSTVAGGKRKRQDLKETRNQRQRKKKAKTEAPKKATKIVVRKIRRPEKYPNEKREREWAKYTARQNQKFLLHIHGDNQSDSYSESESDEEGVETEIEVEVTDDEHRDEDSDVDEGVWGKKKERKGGNGW